MNLFKEKNKILLIFIIVLAFILRFAWLDRFPPALYSDEADQGYNAYSVLKTLHDEHSNLLPLSFRSFGDWKPPLPTYLIVPFIHIFGLNEISVRLPSAVLGVVSVIIIYFLIREIIADKSNKNKIGLLAALFLAISPWHILQSRSAMLVMIALFFLEFGIYLFIRGLQKNYLLIFSSISLVMSVYSYYGMRVVVPLIIIFLFYIYRHQLKFQSRGLILSVIVGILFLLPLGISFIKEKDVVLGRARTVSIFYDQGVKLTQWKLFTEDGVKANTLISRFFHNSLYMYSRKFLQEYLTHFDPKYLFLVGDKSPPFAIPGMGIIYFLDGLFIPIGLIMLAKKNHNGFNILFMWFLISYVPAALTFMVPASNRTFNAVIPLMIFAAFGLEYIIRRFDKKNILVIIAVTVFTINNGYFFKQYFSELPLNSADIWNFGMKEISEKTALIGSKYDNIVFTSDDGMPYIYLIFYQKYSPEKFQKAAVRTYVADRFGYEHVDSFDIYIFYTDRSWNNLNVNLLPNSLYIVPAKDKPTAKYIDIINYPNGKPAYYFITNE